MKRLFSMVCYTLVLRNLFLVMILLSYVKFKLCFLESSVTSKSGNLGLRTGKWRQLPRNLGWKMER